MKYGLSLLLVFQASLVASSFLLSTAAIGQEVQTLRPPPPPPPIPPRPGPSYGLQIYHQEEANAIYWNQKYNAAPSGSWEERYASDQRDQSIQRALQAIHGYDVFQNMTSRDIEMIADQENQKYNAAPSGSALERLYSEARDVAYEAFNQHLQWEVENFGPDWRRLEQFALSLDQKYNAAPSGSAKERAYDQARRRAFDRLPETVRAEITRIYDFRAIEQLAQYFVNKYNAAPSGSVSESAYQESRDLSFYAAEERFRYNVYSYPQNQLYSIIEEYTQKYNAAQSGSRQESYFAQIRDIARGALYDPYGGGR